MPGERDCRIWLGVERLAGERSKRAALIEHVVSGGAAGVVYAATSRHCDELAEALLGCDVRAAACHADRKKDERAAVREAFSNRALDVVVATAECAAELERDDLGFVFHYDLSRSLPDYRDEVERACRGSSRARALLFYSPEDVGIRRFLAESGRLDRDEIERVAQAISEADEPMKLRQLRSRTGLSQAKILRALARLEEVSLVETLPSGEVLAADGAPSLSDAVEVAARSHERRREADRERVEPLRAYVELSTCRRAYLSAQLGYEFEPPCDNCDLCEGPAGERARRPPRSGTVRADERDLFPVASRVLHRLWGLGTVAAYEGDGRGTVVVEFEQHGTRRLSVEVVRRRRLLESAG
jgi:ATP-dependent DNA helicase RecQ